MYTSAPCGDDTVPDRAIRNIFRFFLFLLLIHM
jgi:hypothetical protein